MMRQFLMIPAVILAVCSPLAAEPVRRTWMIDAVEREALLFLPDTPNGETAPVVFAFHGHGGGMRQAASSFQIHREWPEAIVVYMQGLPTPGQLTDPEGRKPGWQKDVGNQNDRDLKFFDAVLKTVRDEYSGDSTRIYSMGHSNGGGFTYLLWAVRGDVFAAIAPSGALLLRHREDFRPLPVMHIAGDNDPLVKYRWQQQMIDLVREVNQCADGKPWHGNAVIHSSSADTPLVTFTTSQGHKFPAEAPELIVRFFKEHQKPVTKP